MNTLSPPVSGIGKREGGLPGSFVRFEKSQQFAENLGGISPVYFLYDYDVSFPRRLPGGFRDFQKRTVDQLELPVARGTPSPHEVFV